MYTCSSSTKLRNNNSWRRLRMEMNILYAHIQPFGEMLQHKHLPTIPYGDEHGVYFIFSTKGCNTTYFCTQPGMETHALYSYSLYNGTLQHKLFHTIIYEMNVLCNPIQRFNTCCILILHSSTKCCNWNTCTQLHMR